MLVMGNVGDERESEVQSPTHANSPVLWRLL